MSRYQVRITEIGNPANTRVVDPLAHRARSVLSMLAQADGKDYIVHTPTERLPLGIVRADGSAQWDLMMPPLS